MNNSYFVSEMYFNLVHIMRSCTEIYGSDNLVNRFSNRIAVEAHFMIVVIYIYVKI